MTDDAVTDEAAAGDLVALRGLVDAYAIAADERDEPGFAALFVPDGVLTVHRPGEPARDNVGSAALAEVPARLRRYERTLHLVSTHSVVLDGDRATGAAYCEAHHLGRDEGGRSDRVLFIRYDDEYRRDAGTWRFARRAVHVLWSETRTADLPT